MNVNKQVLAALVAGGTLVAPAAAQLTIEQIAPENTVIVAGSDNVQTLMDDVQRTKLWDLWKSDEIQDLTKDFFEEFAQNMTKMYEDLGVEEGTLVHPKGPAGIALYTVTDEQTLMPKLAALLYADFADNADKFGTFLDALIAKAADEWDTEFDVEDLLGREVHVIQKPEAPEEPGGDDDMDQQDMGMGNPFMPDPEKLMKQFDRLYVLRDGTRFLAASDPESLRTALEVIDGENEPVLGDREDFQAAHRQLGPCDSYGLLLARDFASAVDSLDESGMVRMMIAPSMPALIGKIGAIGLGYQPDSPNAMLEQRFTLYMPEGKAGIFKLLDISAPRQALPAFAGPDTISYAAVNFDFDGVLDFVRGVIQSNPMLTMQLAEQMPAIEDGIRQFCDPLGKHVQTLRTMRRPLAADSVGMVFAIECNDQVAFEKFIADKGAAMGMEPRDFLGHRIYTMSDGAMGMMTGGADVSFSLGLGGGQLFLGTTPGVEQALRTVGQDNQASLADDGEFHRAVGALGDDAMVGWGYTDVIDSMEATAFAERQQMEQTLKQMEEFDPEMAAEMKADMEEQKSFLDKLDLDLLRRYLGPAVWKIRATDDGYVMSYYMLESDAK